MAGPLTITCPGCREVFTIPAQVLRILGHTVFVRLDRSAAYGHMADCPGLTSARRQLAPEQEGTTVAEDKLPDTELAGRIHLMLAGGHFMAKGGSGACTMCGVGRDECLGSLAKAAKAQPGRAVAPCCPACGDGNTHPAPMESRGTCAEWGAEHGARN